nr:putative late blight resistance protein homolog R1B-17 [Ipomoea batatas]
MLMIRKQTELDPDVENNITAWDTYQSALEPENEVIVGFNSDIETIVNSLCYSHFMRSVFNILRNRNIHKFRKYVENPVLKLQVIPLIGEGGIGKTTLAKRVYGHPITIASFDIQACVVLSQVPNLKEILIGLLRSISPITSEIYTLDDAQIAEQLCTSLMGKKYLIFLDDIWTTAAWDAIKGYFPENFNGSRILVTTRFTEVAEYLSVDPYHVTLVYPCLKLLRVLDLSFVKWSRGMPSEITDLIHLRYMALSTIGSLYKLRFFKLKNLLTLIVTSWMEKCPLQVSCDILGLPQLRHLHVDKRCSQYLPCLVKKNLQTLYWLKVASSDVKPNFGMVPNLMELGIYIEGQLAPSYLGSLVHLHLLEKLKFELGRVERFCLPTGFPPNLKKLTLRYTYLPWMEMDTIGELPHLEVLKLKDFAFFGSKWEPSKQGFRGLKTLLISRSNLKYWDASSNHFPVLERLVLRYCWELKQIPFNFVIIGTLKLILLECCYSSLVTSAMQISSAKKLLSRGTTGCHQLLYVREVRSKVELPNNESSEEEIVENSKVESVDRYEEESVKSSKESVESSKEERVERSEEEIVESFEEESVGSSKELSFGNSKELSVGSSDQLVSSWVKLKTRHEFMHWLMLMKLISIPQVLKKIVKEVLEGCDSSLVISANKIEQKLLKREDRNFKFLNSELRLDRLPNNQGSKEESVELPNNEGFEEESVELFFVKMVLMSVVF